MRDTIFRTLENQILVLRDAGGPTLTPPYTCCGSGVVRLVRLRVKAVKGMFGLRLWASAILHAMRKQSTYPESSRCHIWKTEGIKHNRIDATRSHMDSNCDLVTLYSHYWILTQKMGSPKERARKSRAYTAKH